MKHKTLRGELVDMALFTQANSKQVAIGNASMNAAGDRIGPGGKVIKTRSQIATEYNQTNPRSVRHVPLKDLEKELFPTPAEAVAVARAVIQQKADAKAKRKLTDKES